VKKRCFELLALRGALFAFAVGPALQSLLAARTDRFLPASTCSSRLARMSSKRKARPEDDSDAFEFTTEELNSWIGSAQASCSRPAAGEGGHSYEYGDTSEQTELAFIATLLAEGTDDASAAEAPSVLPALAPTYNPSQVNQMAPPRPAAMDPPTGAVPRTATKSKSAATLTVSVEDMEQLTRSVTQAYVLGTSRTDQQVHALLLKRARQTGHAAQTLWMRGSTDAAIRLHIVFRDRCVLVVRLRCSCAPRSGASARALQPGSACAAASGR